MAVEVYIDGQDISGYGIEGFVTRRLSRPSQAQVKVPYFVNPGDVGKRMKVYIDGELKHHGFVLQAEVEMDEDTGYTVYSSTDAMELWHWRPVRDLWTGDFADPNVVVNAEGNAPWMISQSLLASEEPAPWLPVTPDYYEGPLFIEYGDFPAGGNTMEGAPLDWPMTIAELASLLVSTGELDIVATPIDSGVNMARIDTYHGTYGSDRSGEVVFEYGQGNRNIRHLRWNRDMTTLVNKLWYYLGPRPWKSSITGEVWYPMWPPSRAARIRFRRDWSQERYGVRMEIKVFDSEAAATDAGLQLFDSLWKAEQWFRAIPLEMVHVTPIRGTAINQFDIGDLVTVACAPSIRGGFSGVQRVYEYTISWDSYGVLELAELQASPSNEGF